MDFEQIQKKLDWLDEERRLDKDLIAALEVQVTTYQEEVGKLSKRLNDLEGEIARLSPVKDQYHVLEEKINGVQIELNRQIEQAIDGITEKKEEEETRLSTRFLKVQQEVEDLRKELEVIPELEEQVESRKDEEYKLRRMIAEVEEKVALGKRDDEGWLRTITLLEEARRKDSTRIVELQAESDNIRKRVEEQVGKVDVVAENVRKVDKRIAELRQAETQRSQEQRNYIEQQSLKTVELERDWKNIQSTFAGFLEKLEGYERKMAELSLIRQSLSESQGTFDDNNERIEKRIHEVTEMQRVNREQFLADWETFQGEEKHRWSQFVVEEEEHRKNQERKITAVAENVNRVEEQAQTLLDEMQLFRQGVQSYWRRLIEVSKEFLKGEEKTNS